MDDKQSDGQDDDQTSGSTANPNSDNTTLENAKEMGLYKGADDEHPAELNIANEIQTAEEDRLKNESD